MPPPFVAFVVMRVFALQTVEVARRGSPWIAKERMVEAILRARGGYSGGDGNGEWREKAGRVDAAPFVAVVVIRSFALQTVEVARRGALDREGGKG